MLNGKKVVLTYGSYDMLHVGHVNLLRRAKQLAGENGILIVGINTDEFAKSNGKKTYYSFSDRKTILESIRYVDMVIEETSQLQKPNDIKKYGVDIFTMGSDWTGIFDYLKEYCEVVYLERTPNISTTQTKKDLGLTEYLKDPTKNIGYKELKIK